MDVGVYGVPGSGSGRPGTTGFVAAKACRAVEKFVRDVGGYQMLYADMYQVGWCGFMLHHSAQVFVDVRRSQIVLDSHLCDSLLISYRLLPLFHTHTQRETQTLTLALTHTHTHSLNTNDFFFFSLAFSQDREEFRAMFDHTLLDKVRASLPGTTTAFPEVYDKVCKSARD